MSGLSVMHIGIAGAAVGYLYGRSVLSAVAGGAGGYIAGTVLLKTGVLDGWTYFTSRDGGSYRRNAAGVVQRRYEYGVWRDAPYEPLM